MSTAEWPPAQRSEDHHHHIDPGFINYRKCFAVFGARFMSVFRGLKRNTESDPMATQYNSNLLVDMALAECRNRRTPALGQVLNAPEVGQLFCSTERLEGTTDANKRNARIRNRVLVPYFGQQKVYLEFGTEHFVASTGRAEQSTENMVSIVGQVRRIDAQEIALVPLIMGAPSLNHPRNENASIDPAVLMWYANEWFETYPEDIDEFSRCKDQNVESASEWMEYMRGQGETEVKAKFGELLADPVTKDWGGEPCDHYSASVHIQGRRTSAAFIFKGPAEFREMTLDMLGKRADQINRASRTPARLLVVQHCHTVGIAVREALRAFSVTPHDPRRYCIIDGKDTYRIFRAYGKL